ncbi:MAG: hypothetical protein ABF391_01635 [Akkermansiaceae bacterium]
MIDPEFIQTIYDETAKLFHEGEVKLKGPLEDEETGEVDPRIRIVHQKTGKAIEVDEYDTRMESAIIARIRLACALK